MKTMKFIILKTSHYTVHIMSPVTVYLNILVGCQGDSYQSKRTNSVSGAEQLSRHATVKKNLNRSVFL